MKHHISNNVHEDPNMHDDTVANPRPFQSAIGDQARQSAMSGRSPWPPLRRAAQSALAMLLAIAALATISLARSEEYTFTTLAGLSGGQAAIDGPGSAAHFFSPGGVTVDSAGKAEPVVLSAAPSGIAVRGDQTLRTVPNASTRCAPGGLLVKWKEGPDSPVATLGNAQIGSTVQRNFHEIGWQQVKLPCELSLQEGIARYRVLGSVSAVEPNYAVAPILPPRRDATNQVAGVENTGVPPSVPTTGSNFSICTDSAAAKAV